MPQINRFLYFEYDDGVNPIRTIGDKYVPKTISLTGPNKVEKRLDNVATSGTSDPKKILSIGTGGDITSPSFIAIRSSVAGMLSWEGTVSQDPDSTSSIEILAGEWVTFLGNDTTAHGDGDGSSRSETASQAITGIWFYSSSTADIDVLAFS